ncbi:putative protein kinase [Hamiltosporidium magnivora]|uniref:Protein kinase domain-containing protein n=1 Tax=Hamiltosporidium magnivora TaxID=148818 RepID=A0A4V2JUB2_9MICR|nr:putative protein kinase [Hamiltosporidium magnivora]
MKIFGWNVIYSLMFLYVVMCTKSKRDHNYVLKKFSKGLSNHGYYSGKFIFAGKYSYVYCFKYVLSEESVGIVIPRKQKHGFRFQNKSDISNIIEHENFWKVKATLQIKRRPCVVMPIYENNLYNYIPTLAVFDVKKKEIIKQILDALAYLHHKDICHNAIDLYNIFIDKNEKIVLTDFRLSYTAYRIRMHVFRSSLEETKVKYCKIWSGIKVKQKHGTKTDMKSFGYLFLSMYRDPKQRRKTEVFNLLDPDYKHFAKYFLRKPRKRLSAYGARFSSFFDEIYDFVFCFCKFNDFDIGSKGFQCKKVESRFSVKGNGKRFSIYCKCSEISKELFEKRKLEIQHQNPYWFDDTEIEKFKFSQASSFAVKTNKVIRLLPELSHSEYQAVRNIFFTFLSERSCYKEPRITPEKIIKENKRKEYGDEGRIPKRIKYY